MPKFSLTCTCGHEMSVEAKDKKDAIGKMKEQMTGDEIDTHYQENHSDEPVPSQDEVHQMIEQELTEVE